MASSSKKLEQRELLDKEVFIKRCGIASSSIDIVRKKVHNNMECQLKNAVRTCVKKQKQVIDSLLNANAIDVPTVLIVRERDMLKRQSAQYFGFNEKQTLELLSKMFEEQAKRRIKVVFCWAKLFDNMI